MKLAIAQIEGVSPYSQSKYYTKTQVPMNRGELDSAYEIRTWRNRLHVDEKGFIFIPPMSFKNCISEAAKYLGLKVPGKRGSLYTKHIESGILTANPIVLDVKVADVASETLFVPSNGRRGGTSRVEKTFGVIPAGQWGGTIEIMILDEIVLSKLEEGSSKTVLQFILESAGKFIGIGRFRPKNNGFYGRFDVKKFSVQEA